MPEIEDRIRERAPPRFNSQADRLAYLIAEYKTPITITIIAGAVLILSGRWQIPTIPPIYKVGLYGIAAGALPSAVLAKALIVDPFIDEPTQIVAELDLETESISIHEIPNALWRDRRESERSPWTPEGDSNIDHVVSEIEWMDDIDVLRVDGCNRELVDPMDLIVRDKRIEETHGELIETAAEFERFKARQRTMKLERDREIVSNLIAAVEHGLEFEPGTMEAVQEDRVDEIPDDTDSERSRSDTDPDQPQTLNQLLGYEQDALDTDTDGAVATDGGSQ